MKHLDLAGAGFVLLLLAGSHGCSQPAPPSSTAAPPHQPQARSIHLTDITTDTGIDMVLTSGRLPATQIVEVKGGGLALIDFDNDDDLDLFVPNGATLDAPADGPGARLFENLGGMQFRDVTESAGIAHTRWSMGTAVGDYDGDGFDDLYIACFGRDTLLRNRGDGTFVDTTEAAGLGSITWGAAASFGDIDGDGDLDLYVANYLAFDTAQLPPPSTFKGQQVFAGPSGMPAVADILYANQSDGTFEDISQTAGILARPPAFGLNVVILDFNADGRQDIFVGNDSMPNFYFQNATDPSGNHSSIRFDEIGMSAGIASNLNGGNQATMGVSIGDIDGNGLPDVYTTNFSSDTNTLHTNVDGRYFDDRSQQYGLAIMTRPFLGWACGLYDFEHDGDEDLLVVNGHVYPTATRETMDSPFRQEPLLYARNGPRFERVDADTAGSWLAEAHCDRAAVFGDLDLDGDIDVIIGELNGPLRVLRNDVDDNAWVNVTLRDETPGGNRRGIGARVDLAVGSEIQRRWLYSGGSFQSAGAIAAHFGVPEADSAMELTITWPDGMVQSVKPVARGERLVIRRPAGQ